MSTPSSAASSAVDDLIAWCAAHPVPDTDAERFLRHLCSSPAAIVDRRDVGALCVILDRARSGVGCAPLELAGLRPAALTDALAEALVGAAAEQAARLGLRGIDLMISEEWAPHRRSIERAGFAYAYGDLDMLCAAPDWGQDVALPDGLAWRDLEPGLVDDFLRVYRAAFAGLPGVYFPDEAEQRRVLAVGRGAIRVLCGGDRVLAALRYAPDQAFLHSIVRDPAVKGRGFGRLVLDEARRRLPGRALSLNVVSSNRAALDLYRRHGFAITADRDVLSKSC
ncbi:GNAT family N-acetyltransferase [Dongia sedimenti]|uniref:GNAT family N-acetyltransferase n=1 Tax=Dongia sedimenti TaxID=3064282 RepID=A0ABU0YGR4_9PROT|nr:GNAT family N-acetyltransferase [Rhodospirillaceae bacterium R-7]